MLKIPAASEFGGEGTGISPRLTQRQWISAMKNTGCIGCHQLGQLATRTFPQNIPHPIKAAAATESAEPELKLRPSASE